MKIPDLGSTCITPRPRRVKSGIAATVTAQAKEDGYDVTLYAVRQWAAQGILRVTQAGRKKLINYQSLIDHLEGEATE